MLVPQVGRHHRPHRHQAELAEGDLPGPAGEQGEREGDDPEDADLD